MGDMVEFGGGKWEGFDTEGRDESGLGVGA